MFGLREPERKRLFTLNSNNKKAQRARSCLAQCGPGEEMAMTEMVWTKAVPKPQPVEPAASGPICSDAERLYKVIEH